MRQEAERVFARFSSEAGHTLNSRIANIEIAMGVVRRVVAGRDHRALRELARAIEMLKSAAQSAMWFGRAWQPPQYDQFDLATVAARLARRYRGRRLSWSVPRRLLVFADPHLIERALVELLDNARRFAPRRGGHIDVRIRRRRGRARGKPIPQVIVEVEDNGPGIPGDRKEQVFQPYHSEDRSHFGLGLSIVRRVAEAHAGTAGEYGHPGTGALFRIVLPQPHAEVPQCHRKLQAPRGGPGPVPRDGSGGKGRNPGPRS